MIHLHTRPRTGQLYSITAIFSIALLFGALVHKGSDGPFGPTLDQVTYIASQTEAPEAFEIVYFGSTECDECTSWKKKHLARWRQAALSREVRLTMRGATCGGDPTYASICAQYTDLSGERPVFVLIHRQSGRVLEYGKGVNGFYMVGKKARKWQENWAQRQETATLMQRASHS